MAGTDPGFRPSPFRTLWTPLPRSPWARLAILLAVAAGFVSQIGMPKNPGRRFREFAFFFFILAVVAMATAIQRWLGRGRVNSFPAEISDRSAMPDLVDRLAAAGFYSHARPQDVPTLKQQACETGCLYGSISPAHPDDKESSPTTGRTYFADAEDLAEGGVQKFLEDIRPFLRREGVDLPAISETYDESAYSIHVGGESLVLWEAADWHAKADYHYPWQLTPERTFAFVNRVLARAGSAERLFAINGGEDLEAVFLTEAQFDIIRKHPTQGTWWDKPHRIEDAGCIR